MQFDRQCVSSWESLHLKLIDDQIPIEEIDIDTYCRYMDGDLDVIRDSIFGPGPDETYTCTQLVTTMWQGLRDSCVQVCPDCHDLLRVDLKDTPIIDLAEAVGWTGVQQIVTEFIRFVTTDMLFNFMINRLGTSFMEVSGGIIVCGYAGTQVTCISGWSVIPMFCRIAESSYLSSDILQAMCLVRLLYHVHPFVTIGPTYELAFANVVNEMMVEFVMQSLAALVLQRYWRKRTEHKQLTALGLVLYRKTGILQGNLKRCYENFVSHTSNDLSLVYRIMLDEDM